MQQRCQIARVLANDPPVMLLDEPFGALDALTRERLQDELRRVWAGSGKTALFITHSVEEAVYLSDRVVVMSKGPGRIKREIAVPRDAEWRGFEIEESGTHASFMQTKREIWELIRAEIVRH